MAIDPRLEMWLLIVDSSADPLTMSVDLVASSAPPTQEQRERLLEGMRELMKACGESPE